MFIRLTGKHLSTRPNVQSCDPADRPDIATYVGANSTGQDGSYTVTGLPPGEFVVAVKVTGYVYQYFNGTAKLGPGRPVSVALDVDTSGYRFHDGYRRKYLPGHVYQSDGKTPIAYATVGI